MVYEYSCSQCQTSIDIIKPVSDYDRIENCETCGTLMNRAFAPRKIHLYGTAVQDAYYNNGLGCVVKNDKHARQIAKDRNLIEVGNERPEKHLKIKRQEYE